MLTKSYDPYHFSRRLAMTRKNLVAVVIALGMVAGFCAEAHAALAWYTCTPIMGGPATATGTVGTYMSFTDTATTPKFTRKWFKAPDGKESQMLAIYLTAISIGRKVMIYTDVSSGTYPTIINMYMNEN